MADIEMQRADSRTRNGKRPTGSMSGGTFIAMLRARLLETKLASLYKAGKIVGGVYIGKGQEAVSARPRGRPRSGAGTSSPP